MVMEVQNFYFLKKLIYAYHHNLLLLECHMEEKHTFSSACDNLQKCIWLEIADNPWRCMFASLWKMDANIFTYVWHLLRKDKSWSEVGEENKF